MPYTMNEGQWTFVQDTLEKIRSMQLEIEGEKGVTLCGSCKLCCQIQTPYVSFLDAFWAVQGIRRLGLWDAMKIKLKAYLSASRPLGLYTPCPLLGDRGCMIHGWHPMVCRSYNFTRPGAHGCGLARRPGMLGVSKADDMVDIYMKARIEFEEKFGITDKGSIAMLPAAIYTIMSDPGEIEESIAKGELCEDNFRVLIRDDEKEYSKFIGYNLFNK